MSSNQAAVVTAISVLLSTTPEEPLGKLLNLCLASKLEGDVEAKAKELFDKPESLAYWVNEVMGSDDQYTAKECLASGDMDLTDVDEFVKALMKDIESLKL